MFADWACSMNEKRLTRFGKQIQWYPQKTSRFFIGVVGGEILCFCGPRNTRLDDLDIEPQQMELAGLLFKL